MGYTKLSLSNHLRALKVRAGQTKLAKSNQQNLTTITRGEQNEQKIFRDIGQGLQDFVG